VQTNSEILCLVPLSPSMFSAKPQPSPLSMWSAINQIPRGTSSFQ
jgi:hypothetical protein